jgi:hypothetical protein
MGVPSWNEDPDAWDRIEINGFEFAETEVDVDGDFGNDFDVKKAPGADGATLTNKGVEPIKPSVKWTLWKDEHWDIYQALIAKVYPYPGKTPLPLVEVIHPQLQLLKKVQFRLVRVHTLKRVGPQMMQAQFDLLEYFPVPKSIPKPAPAVTTRTRERAIIERETSKPSVNPSPVKDVIRPALL